MMSLDNAFSSESSTPGPSRLAKQVPADTAFVCELKIDGLAISLTYRDGRFVQAATRGDGRTGEDVTATWPRSPTSPTGSAGISVPSLGDRGAGEVYMPISAFEDLNRRQAEAGERLFVQSPQFGRGLAAAEGSEGHRGTGPVFWGYQVGQLELVEGDPARSGAGSSLPGSLAPTHAETLEWLERAAFPVNPQRQLVHGLDAALDFCQRWRSTVTKLDYEIDGVVVKGDDLALQRQLGSTSRAPGGHRLQVPARGADHYPEGHRRLHRSDRQGTPFAVLERCS